MPFYKYIFNRSLTVMEKSPDGQTWANGTAGLRAYSRKVLENDSLGAQLQRISFSTGEFLVQAAAFGFRLGDIPVPAR